MRGPRSLRTYLTPAVAWIFMLQVGSFLVYLFATAHVKALLEYWVVLIPATFIHGHVWTLISTAFLNVQPLSFLIDALLLWVFVPQLERHLGTKRFLVFTAATVLTANAVSLGLALLIGGKFLVQPIGGLSGLVLGGMALIGATYANQPVNFLGAVPIKGKHLVIGTLIFVLLFSLLQQDWPGGAGTLAAIGLGWIWHSTGSPSAWLARWRRTRLRRKYQVLDGGAGPGRGKNNQQNKQWLN